MDILYDQIDDLVGLQSLLFLAFVGPVLWAALWDVRTLTIPNHIPLTLLILWPLSWLATPWPETAQAMLWAMVIFLIGAVFFTLRWFGGGDVKFFSAVVLWTAPDRVFELIFLTAMAGGLLAMTMISPLGDIISSYNSAMAGRKKQAIPYGLAIAAAAIYIGISKYLLQTRLSI